MPRKALLLIASLLFSAQVRSEGLGAFLPGKDLLKATRILAAIDQLSAEIESRREAARMDQLRAEADAVEQYALIAASREGQGAWAKPDGSAQAAAVDYAAARARAQAAADVLASIGPAEASGPGAIPALVASREAAGDSLASMIIASGIGEKSATGLERFLADKSKASELFPEAADAAAQLSRAGASGARVAAAAMAYRGAEEIAQYLIASKARIAAMLPASANALGRLEVAFAAYRAWEAASAFAAYPGELDPAQEGEREALAAGIRAVAGMASGRAAALLAAMASGDGRDAAAAEAARRLAGLWDRSPETRRGELSSLCDVPRSVMALFSSAVSAADEAPRVSSPAAKAPRASDWLSILSSLNGLEATIAEEETRASSGRGESAPGVEAGLAKEEAEPVLLLLERPELTAVARSEPRYAGLYAEAAHRLDSLYSQAADGASTRLEASPSLAKAAALALGSAPAAITVRSIDLRLPPGEYGRRIAFFAVTRNASGQSVSIPLPAGKAGEEYAAAFAKAAGLLPVKADPAALLVKYRQFIVSAYDPEGLNDALAIDVYPDGGGAVRRGDRLGATDLELALIGGWRP
jgi:hypothetical protein